MGDALSGSLTKDAVELELQNILTSRTFAESVRSRRFLEFAVTKRLVGDEAGLKGSVVAIEVFGKNGDFDGRLSSAVRTGANRLRRMLQTYYQTEGVSDRIVISLPEGRYIPEFTACTQGSRESRTIGPAENSDYGETPVLVGRDDAFTTLRNEFRLVIDGRGHLLSVIAEPGIGKTALVNAFLNEVNGNSATCVGVAQSRIQLQFAQPYQVWLETLASIANADESVWDILRAVASHWWQRLEDSEVNDRTTVAVLRGEMERFLSALTTRGPVVLFMDDLHWADAGTIDLLHQILPAIRSSPVLFIAAYRSSDMRIRQDSIIPIQMELKMKGLSRDLVLRELPLEAIELYFERRFPGHAFAPGVAAGLHHASGGNALCVNDMVEHAVRCGWIKRDTEHWEFTAAPSIWRTALPDSVRAMTSKKLDELESRDRQLLWVSSLQGLTFDSSVAADAMGLERSAVEHRLERLCRKHQLLRVAPGNPLPFRGDRYEFAHVLYFDALQESASPAQRAEFSRRTAEAIATQCEHKRDLPPTSGARPQ